MNAKMSFKGVEYVLSAALLLSASWAHADHVSLDGLDLQDLMKVEMVSSSKFKQELSEVTASAFIISEEDIANSGATNLPQLLAMVPGLSIFEATSNSWAMGVRGFNSVFSNKMLVMIDGRSIFSPLFSGVFWEQLDLFLPDIERIEVIRGIGSTVWGANAVNGIINIITKSTLDNENGRFYLKTGDDLKYDLGARFGAEVSGQSYARFYAKSKDIDAGDFVGGNVDDSWTSHAVGGKWEWFSGRDSLLVSGDWIEQDTKDSSLKTSRIGVNQVPIDSRNRNISAQWQRQMSTDKAFTMASQWQQSVRDSDYYRIDDHMVNFDLDTSIAVGDHQWLFGLGMRRHDIDFQPGQAFSLSGSTDMTASRAKIYSAYFQDVWQLAGGHHLLVGNKFEAHRHPHGDKAFNYEEDLWLPTVRYRFDMSAHSRLWLALSRSARVPSISEHIVQIPVFTLEALSTNNPLPWDAEVLSAGNSDFGTERVESLEIGFRTNINNAHRIDLVMFHSHYRNTRTFMLQQPFCLSNGLPLPGCAPGDKVIQLNTFENNGRMDAFGLELSYLARISNDLSLSASYSFMNQVLETTPSNAFEEPMYLAPRHQLIWQVDWRLLDNWDVRVQHKYLGGIDDNNARVASSNPYFLDHYHKLDLVAGYRLSDGVKLQMRIDNLLDEDGVQWTQEFPSSNVSRMQRRVSFGIDVSY